MCAPVSSALYSRWRERPSCRSVAPSGARKIRRSVRIPLLLIFLAPLGATLLQLGLSRQREYSADETGAHMVGHPYGLISALQKLGAYNNRIPTTQISPTTSALCIVKPLFGGGTFSSLFSTHTPLEDRIATLRELAATRQL